MGIKREIEIGLSIRKKLVSWATGIFRTVTSDSNGGEDLGFPPYPEIDWSAHVAQIITEPCR